MFAFTRRMLDAEKSGGAFWAFARRKVGYSRGTHIPKAKNHETPSSRAESR